jgi:hypothetical protein
MLPFHPANCRIPKCFSKTRQCTDFSDCKAATTPTEIRQLKYFWEPFAATRELQNPAEASSTPSKLLIHPLASANVSEIRNPGEVFGISSRLLDMSDSFCQSQRN